MLALSHEIGAWHYRFMLWGSIGRSDDFFGICTVFKSTWNGMGHSNSTTLLLSTPLVRGGYRMQSFASALYIFWWLQNNTRRLMHEKSWAPIKKRSQETHWCECNKARAGLSLHCFLCSRLFFQTLSSMNLDSHIVIHTCGYQCQCHRQVA